MIISASQSIIIITVIALVTFFTRAVPFLVFSSHNETPKYIVYLGRVLPPAVIGMLIVYCVKNVRITEIPYGIPEIISIAIVAVLHVWKRNNLISILGGTLIYMFLVQAVF
ncbi:MAG: AzlD domain-containing protein [Tissierellia bacterium]|nr:AzlD domain-containing protein [Tissierellia bacterium]MDD4781568.1 AzlD domain-containing protein [Tissierellia bacterium]